MRATVGIAALVASAACTALSGLEDLEFEGAGEGGTPAGAGGTAGNGGSGGMAGGGGALGGGGNTGGQMSGGGGTIDPNCELEVLGSGMGCPPQCTSCIGGICEVSCTSNCSNDNIDCPPDFACHVTCDAAEGCQDLTVFCPENHPCTLVCVNPDTCTGARVHCSATAPCDIVCSASPGACEGATVLCDAKACIAHCADPAVTKPGLMCLMETCLCQPC